MVVIQYDLVVVVLVVLVATTLLKLLIHHQDANTLFAQEAVGLVVNHTHVQQEWDVVHM